MSSDRLMFAGVLGLALAACASPSSPEDKETLGKVSSAETYTCQCSGMSGTWTANYPSAAVIVSELEAYCNGSGSCTNASSSGGSSSPPSSSGSPGYGSPTGGYGAGGGGSFPANPFGYGSGGGGGGASSTPPNSSNIPRDGVFRTTSDYWNTFYTYHDERSEAGFNDGDSVRFFDNMKEAKNYQNVSAFSSLIPGVPYAAGVAIFALGKLSDAQIDAIANKYATTGRQQGIRVVVDTSTEMYTGITTNYLIYNISDGALLGQISFVIPSMVSNTNGRCQYGAFGDVGVAAQSCSNGITACNSGYNCS